MELTPAASPSERPPLARPELILVVGLLAVGLLLLVILESLRLHGTGTVVGEWGAIELTQLVLLALSMGVLGRMALVDSLRALTVPMVLLTSAVVIRELDAAFDVLFHGSWKYPAWLAAALGVSYAMRGREAALLAMNRVRSHRSLGLFAGALFVVLVQSRLLGRQDVWRSVLGADFMRSVPRLIEEITELAGYGILLVACVDLAAFGAAVDPRVAPLTDQAVP